MTHIPTARRGRAGVTLVELLVVCAIIAMLSTMAFPALSGAVARSRLTVCTNNQNQLGYSIIRYDEQFGCLPGYLNVITTKTTSIPASWAVSVLPFVGRSDIYDDIVENNALPLMSKREVNTYICPSQKITTGTNVLHYAANAGSTGLNPYDGVFLNTLSVPKSTIDFIGEKDGTAMTLAFTEKSSLDVTTPQPHRWTCQVPVLPPTATQQFLFGSGTASVSDFHPVFGVNPMDAATTPVINNPLLKHFAPSSNHNGGVSVAFCDGHTAFLSDKIATHVYAQLLTPRTRWTADTSLTPPVKAISSDMRNWLLKSGTGAYVLDTSDLDMK